MKCNSVSIPKLRWCNWRWSNSRFYCACEYLSMQGSNLIHFSKRCAWYQRIVIAKLAYNMAFVWLCCQKNRLWIWKFVSIKMGFNLHSVSNPTPRTGIGISKGYPSDNTSKQTTGTARRLVDTTDGSLKMWLVDSKFSSNPKVWIYNICPL